ncbi:unnamed protein product [Caenorhabditis sp. 36 PRJEB53466]|nr:unnamed protein product [Caenorhabditis sp. 36 PRJEB53466]
MAENLLATCAACCCAMACLMVVTIIDLSLAIYFLTLGIVKLDECPVSPNIPVWMIVMAALMFLERILSCATRTSRADFEDEEVVRNRAKVDFGSVLSSIVGIVVLIGFLAGCYLVFSIHSPQPDQCDALLYWSSFVYCIIGVGVTVFIVVSTCCAACGAFFFLKYQTNS